MKKLILAALLMTGMASFAQEKTGERKHEKLSVEQRNELRLKKMALELDLTPAQQKDMAGVIAEQSSKREAAMAQRKAMKEQKKELSADERFAKQKQMLDEKIATKARVKKILTDEQFKKWELSHGKSHDKMRKHMKKRAEKGVKRQDSRK